MLLAVRRANGAQSHGTNIVVAAFFDISHDPYEWTSDRLWIGLSSYESSASPRTIPSTVVFIIVDLSIDRRIRSSGSNLENKLPSTEARSQADRVVTLPSTLTSITIMAHTHAKVERSKVSWLKR